MKIAPETRQAILDGLHGAASAPGGTSTPVFQGFPIPIAGKTGTAEKGVGKADQSWYVALAPYPNPRYVVAVTDEAGGFGADTAAPMARRDPRGALRRQGDRARAGRRGSRLMHASAATAVKDFHDESSGAPVPHRPAAAAGDASASSAASVYILGSATQDDIPGDPNYYVYRQAAYAGVGIVLMLLISRFDYSRLREWKLGIYAFLIGSILLVYALGVSARGSKRAIELPFFSFQPSELGKVLLIVSLSAFMVDRVRRLTSARRPAASCCWRSSRRCS